MARLLRGIQRVTRSAIEVARRAAARPPLSSC